MRWLDSHLVEGTDPPVRVGRPAKVDRTTGALRPLRVYHERFTLGGRQVSRSLETGNRKEAIRRVIERQELRLRGEAPAAIRSMTVGAALREFLEVSHNRGLAPKTIEKYGLVIRGLNASLAGVMDQPASAFSEREFWLYRRSMVDAGLKPKTIYDRLIVVKQTFNYLVRVRRIAFNPLAAISLSRPESDVQPVFTPQQVTVLLGRAYEYERPIIAFLTYTGARFGEARDIEWDDILWDRGEYGFIRISKGGSGNTTKDKESRLIPLHPQLRTILKAMVRRGARVFTCQPCKRYPNGDGPLDHKSLLRRLKRLCGRCGFENPTQYKLHTFRHFFASMHARHGTSYRYALEFLGHSDSRILNLYYHIYDRDAERAILAIDIEGESKDSNEAA